MIEQAQGVRQLLGRHTGSLKVRSEALSLSLVTGREESSPARRAVSVVVHRLCYSSIELGGS